MDANQIHKAWIDDFWSHFGGNKNIGFGYSSRKKLSQLKRLSHAVIVFKSQESREVRRAKFDRRKRRLHGMKGHGPCFVCGVKGNNVRHHIILLKNGGINCKRNIVTLCRPCHAKIHPWLSAE